MRDWKGRGVFCCMKMKGYLIPFLEGRGAEGRRRLDERAKVNTVELEVPAMLAQV